MEPISYQKNSANLDLLGRPDLGETLTKLHVFGLEQVQKAVFLDADTLLVDKVDELFEYLEEGVEFAASPDIGWPDCFNSGVFAYRPSTKLYDSLIQFAKQTVSFDGISGW